MFVEILVHTQIWVFGLLGFLLFLGWQQSQNRIVKKNVIFILPIGMLLLSYFGVFSSFGISLLTMSLWILGVFITAYACFIAFPVRGVSYNIESASYKIMGSWVPLTLMMAIFFTKYVIAVLSVLNPTLLENTTATYTCSFIYGAFSGVFIARALSVQASSKVVKIA